MASEDPKKKERGSFRKSLSSMFKSPAAETHDRVLAQTCEQQKTTQPNSVTEVDDDEQSEKQISDKEGANSLVAQPDAQSPSGHSVLGYAKQLNTSQGYPYASPGPSGLTPLCMPRTGRQTDDSFGYTISKVIGSLLGQDE